MSSSISARFGRDLPLDQRRSGQPRPRKMSTAAGRRPRRCAPNVTNRHETQGRLRRLINRPPREPTPKESARADRSPHPEARPAHRRVHGAASGHHDRSFVARRLMRHRVAPPSPGRPALDEPPLLPAALSLAARDDAARVTYPSSIASIRFAWMAYRNGPGRSAHTSATAGMERMMRLAISSAVRLALVSTSARTRCSTRARFSAPT